MKRIETEMDFFIGSKRYTPYFNMGDMVCYVTDEDERPWMIHRYIINYNGVLQYGIQRSGTYETCFAHEIKLKN